MNSFNLVFNNNETQIIPLDGFNPMFWVESLGIGYLKSNGFSYDEDYWKKYHSYRSLPIAYELNNFRCDFVKKYGESYICGTSIKSNICDIGIGSGLFVESMQCYGFDINLHAKKWLIENNFYANPYETDFDVLTFWDVLEHLDDPSVILSKIKKYAIVSIPIHKSLEDCLKSKHLRPNEHIWHFTHNGFQKFMEMHGFKLIDTQFGEIKAGREDIVTYCFSRL